jgi:hypothetical protein
MDYIELYHDKCLENKDLRDEIDILQKILHLSLPVIGDDVER